MSHSYDQVKDCFILGHLYSSVVLLRCPHREGYSVTARVWRDNDTEEPTVIWEADREFGPFDSLEHIEQEVGTLSALACWHLQQAEAVVY